MEKVQRIKKNSHFQRLYKKGKSFVSPCFVLYLRENQTQNLRMGITVSKKVGKAFLRNRAKRVLRVAVREAKLKGLNGYDLILVARAKTPFVKSTVVSAELLKILRSGGFIKEEKE